MCRRNEGGMEGKGDVKKARWRCGRREGSMIEKKDVREERTRCRRKKTIYGRLY